MSLTTALDSGELGSGSNCRNNDRNFCNESYNPGCSIVKTYARHLQRKPQWKPGGSGNNCSFIVDTAPGEELDNLGWITM